MTIDEIKEKTVPILKQHGVTYAAVFGSVARGEDRPQSDVDILVRLGRPTGMVGYMKLVESLEWERLDNRRASRIVVYRPGSIEDDDRTLRDIHDWMVARLLQFRATFDPLLAREVGVAG